MNEIENEMKLLEAQGAKLEDMLRFSNNSDNWGKVCLYEKKIFLKTKLQDDDGLMKEWLTIVKKRNHLGRRDTELGYRSEIQKFKKSSNKFPFL